MEVAPQIKLSSKLEGIRQYQVYILGSLRYHSPSKSFKEILGARAALMAQQKAMTAATRNPI